MDTSKKYIEMCEKAEEIQESWKCAEDDYESLKGAWLPRQDQLQEMVAKMPTWTDTRPVNILCRFWNWWPKSNWWLCSDDTTLEQLWLAFVMKEKHNKTWNGKEWVKDEL